MERESKDGTKAPSLKISRRTHSTNVDYLLLSSLSGMIQTSSDTWLINSGASCHMIGY